MPKGKGKYAGLPDGTATATAVPVASAAEAVGAGKADDAVGKTESFEIGAGEVRAEAVSVSPGSGEEDWERGEVQSPGYRDVHFAVAFWVHVLIVLVVALSLGPSAFRAPAGHRSVRRARRLASAAFPFIGGAANRGLDAFEPPQTEEPEAYNEEPPEVWRQEEEDDDEIATSYASNPTFVPVSFMLSLVVAPIVTVPAMSLLSTHADPLIRASLYFGIGLSLVVCVLSAAVGAVPVSIFYGIFAAILGCYARAVWNRIPYAAANLKSAVTAVKANLGIALLAFVNLPVTFLWYATWGVALFGTMNSDFFKSQVEEVEMSDHKSGETMTPLGWFVLFLFCLSFYWTVQVIKNTLLTTIAGVIGTWWFSPIEANSFCSSAVTDSLLRSSTYSFGSICFGSLLVAILQVLRDSMRNARNNNRGGVLVCIAACLLVWIERLMEYFNKWAFIYVGLYGYGYVEAGKRVMSLFRSRGWTTVISDSLVHRVLGMMCLAVGLVVGLFCALVTLAMTASGEDAGIAMLIGVGVGVVLSGIGMGVVGSAVDAILVCFAEAPKEFRDNHPELHQEMESTYTDAWPDVNFRVVVVPL